MLSCSLHVDSHKVPAGVVQGAEHVASQIRSDDGVFSLSGLGCHSEVEGVHICLGHCNLRVPERVASADTKMIAGSWLGVLGRIDIFINRSTQHVEQSAMILSWKVWIVDKWKVKLIKYATPCGVLCSVNAA